jgi:hypothetical protein
MGMSPIVDLAACDSLTTCEEQRRWAGWRMSNSEWRVKERLDPHSIFAIRYSPFSSAHLARHPLRSRPALFH